jgi:hypothetical protein
MDGRDAGLTPVQTWAGINGQKKAGRLGGVEEIPAWPSATSLPSTSEATPSTTPGGANASDMGRASRRGGTAGDYPRIAGANVATVMACTTVMPRFESTTGLRNAEDTVTAVSTL